MSRNTFILLGLLTGSIALIGCSKNITAPSVETDRQAQTLTCPVVAPGPRVENELEEPNKDPLGWRGNKQRFNDLEMEVGSGDIEVSSGEGVTLYDGIQNKGRRMLTESETGQGTEVNIVAPAPIPVLGDDF